MSVVLTDEEIASRIAEPKRLAPGFRKRLESWKEKRGGDEATLSVRGDSGTEFTVILRRNRHNPFNFSVTLACEIANTTRTFRLRRYNGKAHEHTNRLEKTRFYNCHIHTATERYQEAGAKEESFAEPTDRFGSLEEALECLLRDCAFIVPDEPQMELPLGGGSQ